MIDYSCYLRFLTLDGIYLFLFFYILGPQLRREDNVGPSKPRAFSIRSINESLADYEKHAHSKGFYKTP